MGGKIGIICVSLISRNHLIYELTGRVGQKYILFEGEVSKFSIHSTHLRYLGAICIKKKDIIGASLSKPHTRESNDKKCVSVQCACT